jgi:hypothetical protein
VRRVVTLQQPASIDRGVALCRRNADMPEQPVSAGAGARGGNPHPAGTPPGRRGFFVHVNAMIMHLDRKLDSMAYYLVERMPSGRTMLIEATSAKEAAQRLKSSGTESYGGTEHYLVFECDREGNNCSDSPEQFSARDLFPEHHPS